MTEMSRRRFLLVSGAALLLAGCAPSPSPPSPTTTTPASGPSVRSLVAADRFVVGHRGSGDNWTEHSLTAYRNALAAGVDALEISVCATSDGVLVCHHDTSALRLLGVDRAIAELSWPELQELRLDARRWLGPETPLEPVSRLEDVLAELGDDLLAFVEDKQGTNTGPLLDILDAQPRSTDRFVWKQWAGAKQGAQARERGYLTWGYFEEDQADRVAEFAEAHDILGIPVGASDEAIASVVSQGKPVMAWEVRFRDDMQRLEGLGVAGLMCANVLYILDAAPADRDAFASGRRAAGDLPALIDRFGWGAQPLFVPERDAVRIQRPESTSYLMGSLADGERTPASVEAVIAWPEAVPAEGCVGLAVGLDGDAPGGDDQVGAANGCLVEIDVAGELRLVAIVEGARGAILARASLPRPSAGVPVGIRVVLDDGIEATCSIDDVEATASAPDAAVTGAWTRLVKAYATSEAVEFSAVRITR